MLGLDARLQLLTFSDKAPTLDAARMLYSTRYGSQPWLSLGARFTYLF